LHRLQPAVGFLGGIDVVGEVDEGRADAREQADLEVGVVLRAVSGGSRGGDVE